MSKKPLPYQEGSWFAVPLRDGGYALGLAARVDGRGGVLGYFFGPRVEGPDDLRSADRPAKEDAILVAQFGDLDLIEGNWPVLETDFDWDRTKWPMPRFARFIEDLGIAWLSEYDEDSLRRVSEEPIDPSEVTKYPSDSLSGSGAIEIKLSKLLPESENRAASDAH